MKIIVAILTALLALTVSYAVHQGELDQAEVE